MIIQLSSVENMEVEVSRNSVGCQQGNRFFWFLIFSCNALEMLNYWVWSFFHVCYTKQSTKIYLYTHTHIHAYIQIYCASVYMYPCPKPVCTWVLHSKHSLKEFFSFSDTCGPFHDYSSSSAQAQWICQISFDPSSGGEKMPVLSGCSLALRTILVIHAVFEAFSW